MKLLQKILFPFSLVYGSVAALRNYFFDKGWLKSQSYDLPVICVGNLSTGGTGKSPMVEYLIGLLQKDYRVGVLSRGYKRTTRGYMEVVSSNTAREVGDEPLQFKQNFPNALVAVCEDRRKGIEKLKLNVDVILLDDAFQHRRVQASTSLLLTPFNDLYTTDYVLPAGNLREFRKGAKRADIIVVTKCPEGVAYAELQEIERNLSLLEYQKLYFSKIGYDELIYGPSETLSIAYLQDKAFTLVTGIANPKPLIHFLHRKEFKFEHIKYPDHHDFSDSEIKKLKKNELILTTEKDYVRLQPKLGKFAIYYLPIKTLILKEQEVFFKKTILKRVRDFRFNRD
jgi:tetraacyldisaccharide 4'-kinase